MTLSDWLFSAAIAALLWVVWRVLRRSGWNRARSRRDDARASPAKGARPDQRKAITGLRLRAAIFTVTDAADIPGYALTPLGPVQTSAPDRTSAETRLAYRAAERYGAANAVVGVTARMRQGSERAGTGPKGGAPRDTGTITEWHGQAVDARPLDPALAPPVTWSDSQVLIDGSNVINWAVDAGEARAPSLEPLRRVIDTLRREGLAPGIVFDATAGHRLDGQYLGREALLRALPGAEDVHVVDKGTTADAFLINVARTLGLIIVSNDHFRDNPAARHLLKRKGFIEGGVVHLLSPRA